MVQPLQWRASMRVVTLLGAVLLSACVAELPGPGGTQPDGGDPSGPPSATALAMLKQWSGCMTLANFTAADMANAWGTLLTSTSKQCQNCHDDGQYGFVATQDEESFFAKVTQHSSFMAMYFSADVPNNKVVINTTSFKGANSSVGHPQFNPLMNQGMTALTAFHTATAANTACEAPKMID